MTLTKTKRLINNRLQDKSISRALSQWGFFMLGLILLVLSVFVNSRSARVSASALNQGHSSAFRGRGIADPVQLPDLSAARTYPVGLTPFGIVAPPATQTIAVSLLYQCEGECQSLWLKYQLDSAGAIWSSRPIHHPLTQDRPWYRLFDGHTVIYQKQPLVFSVPELAASRYRIITEPALAEAYGLTSPHLSYLQDNPNPDEADIIFTSRLPLADKQAWHQYRTVISTPGIRRSAGGELVFAFQAAQPTTVLDLTVTYPEPESTP